MKTLIVVALFMVVTLISYAGQYGYEQYGQYGNDTWGRDYYGHATKVKNYWSDRDGDGVPNYYDRRDDNRYIW